MIYTMKFRGFDVLYAVLMALVFPSLIISFISGNQGDQENLETIATSAQETSVAQLRLVSVLTEDRQVKEMELEAYVLGVVLREMPAEFEPEALKAQAVVARTYTLRRIQIDGKHTDADVCTDPSCCQGYCDPQDFLESSQSEEMLLKVSDAVAATSGQVLLYEGALIEATYFSCSGGLTEDAVAVWGADIPYLKSVDSPGEEGAAHFTDKVTLTTEEFNNKMGGNFRGFPELWIEGISYTQGGGVEQIKICGKVYTGTQIRKLLSLRSTAFTIHIVADTVTITTKGFGHRVGMSQYGAEAMAVQGNSYKKILTHYYQNTTLSQIKSIG